MKLRYTALFLCLCLGLCLCLSACGTPFAPPDYRSTAFRATLSWESKGLTVRATLETRLGEQGRAVPVCMTILAPSAVAGAVLTRNEGGVLMTHEGMETYPVSAQSMFRIGELLCSDGALRDIGKDDWEGTAVQYAELLDGDERLVLTREAKTGIPLRVESATLVVTVSEFSAS